MAVVMMGGDDKDPTFHDFLGMSSSSNNGDADNGNGSSSPPPNPNTSNREMVDAEASVGFSSGAHRVVSGTSDLGSERQGQNNSEIFHFHGRKDTVVDRETSNTLSGRKRNSSSSYMSLIRDRMLSLGSNSIEGSQPIKAFGRSHDDAVPYSVQPPPRPTSSLLLQTAVNVRPDLLFSKWEQSLPMNAGSVGPYSSHFGQSGTQMEMLTSYTHKDANISATVITSSAADEGSRTGMKGSGILKMISPSSSKAGEKYSTGRMLYSNNPKAPEVVEPESSNLRSRCNLTPSTRQMTIFYAGQAHVFDDVHPNKLTSDALVVVIVKVRTGKWQSKKPSLPSPFPIPLSLLMGCTASKLDNEDTVRRCKERHRLIKDAVQSRHLLASAHSDYLRSLLYTGSALTRFARGEPISVSHQTPPILLHSSNPPPPPPPIPSSASSTPPPPPPAPFSPSPSPTIASSTMPHILLSESTTKSARAPHAMTNFALTPSQASSVWDWENFYPPSPPDSEFFDRIKKDELGKEERFQFQNRHHHLQEENEDEEEEEEEEEEMERREEVRCSEWGGDQHCGSSMTSSSTKSDEEDEDEYSRSAARSEFNGSEPVSRPAPSEIGSSVTYTVRKGRSETGSSSGWTARDDSSVGGGDMRMVVRHRDLAEIVAALEEYFVKAAGAGEQMSEILETGREQLDRSFRQLKKTVYHSNSVLSALSSTWTSKPPLAIKYRLDTGALEVAGSGNSLGSTLERLLAWEKKLYKEVKDRESVKIEHQKKLSTLQSLEYRGKNEAKIDKTKASIQKLQSLILVTSQAVATTSTAITNVRDNELSSQLVNFCFSLLSMWRSINQFHELQNHIVHQVRGLANRPSAGDSTSDLHRIATRDLETAISDWHSNFNRLIKHQREYIRALYGWLKLTLIHVGNVDNQQNNQHSSSISVKLTAFCDEWKQALDRVPDTVASEAIKSFMNVVHVIHTKQEEELRIKKRTETYSKELDKKSTALRAIEKKFYQTYSTVGIGISGSGRHNGDGQVFDSRDLLAEKKLEIAACRSKVEDEMTRHGKAVEVTRSMTLNNIQTGLPGVFQAMAGFSGMFAEAMEGVCRRAATVK